MDIKRPAAQYLTILIVCFFAFFVNNSLIPADLMESRNLATAQEMVRTGNYLVPTMNGELRLEKPPLPTWIAAAVEHIFPESIAAQRNMAGLAGTLMVIFLYLLVRRLTRERRLALISALTLATCYNVVMMGRTATWDIYCHSFMLGGIFFLVRALQEKGARWKDFLLAGTFMGLSFLGKGPVSFFALLLPFTISYCVVFRPSIKGKAAPLITMLLVCAVISFWWPGYIAIFHPDSGLAVAEKESTAWISHNTRPFWYYWQFPAEAGIWALFWVTSIVYFFRYKKPEQRTVFRFFIIWTFTALILLSLVPEKKPRYLLPVLIPGAVNIAFYIWHSMKNALRRSERNIFRINGTVIALISAALPLGIFIIANKESGMPWPLMTAITICFLAISAYILTALYGRGGMAAKRVFAGVVLLMMAFEGLCLPLAAKLFINEERYSIRMLRDDHRVKGLEFLRPHDGHDVRMELVYDLNSTLRDIDLDNDSLLYAKMPFVLISTEPADNYLAGKDVSLEYISEFENNWHKRSNKLYNPNLFNHATVIRPKISK